MKKIISVITTMAIVISTSIPVSADTTIITEDKVLVNAFKKSDSFDQEREGLSGAVWVSNGNNSYYGDYCGCSHNDAETWYCICGNCDESYKWRCYDCWHSEERHYRYTGYYTCNRCNQSGLTEAQKSAHAHYYEPNYGYDGTESTFYEQNEVG